MYKFIIPISDMTLANAVLDFEIKADDETALGKNRPQFTSEKIYRIAGKTYNDWLLANTVTGSIKYERNLIIQFTDEVEAIHFKLAFAEDIVNDL